MAAKGTNKGKTETFIIYEVVKAHDGLMKGEQVRRKAGCRGAEYCVELGLWRRKPEKDESVTAKEK